MSLPRQRADAILPLEITPKPNKLVRVLVGRMEIMTREDTEQMFELFDPTKEHRDARGGGFHRSEALWQVLGADDLERS